MPKTIPFDAKIAKELQQELSSLMYDWDEASGRYYCRFCYRSCPPVPSGQNFLNHIDHFECLGERTLEELDAKLAIDS